MICESSSNSTNLAPGFRFHPTDEELVSYYLKRKVSGLPLRVDAIAEIDLYKKEPWELPSLSKLQSRDAEWYFFSPLDRKYSNRTRTNRATFEGYWKTTGKDRVVKHAYSNSVVGMKKTLVFHHGRAPKGKRTNWVMHEYRLEFSENDANGCDSTTLVHPQDSFVVCRIFQKHGSGPQNGAQYGAPFIAEEWEETQDNNVPKQEEEYAALVCQTNGQCCDEADVGLKNQLLVLPQRNTDHVSADSKDGQSQFNDQAQVADASLTECEEQGCYSHADDLFLMLEDIFDLDKLNGVPENMHENNSSIANDMVSDQDDLYLELNDIANTDGLCTSKNTFDNSTVSDFPYEAITSENGFEIFDNINRTLGTEDVFNLQSSDDFLNPSSGNYLEDNAVFYDAPSNAISSTGDAYLDMNSNTLFSPNAADFDLVDDLMAYFDASENDVLYDPPSSDKSDIFYHNFESEVEGNSYPTIKERIDASSSVFTNTANPLESTNKNNVTTTEVVSNDGWNKSLKKHVVGMLGSISAPPAMADETCKGKATHIYNSNNSLITTTVGMIKIHSVSVKEKTENWAFEKSGEISFVYAYANTALEISPCFKPLTRTALGVLLRSGFYIFGISALILSISLKLGTSIYKN